MRTHIVLVAIVTVSCGYYRDVKDPGEQRTANAGTSTLGFQSVRAIVFEPHCISCHSQSGGDRAGINLESYVRVAPVSSSIRSTVVSGRMPLGATLPDKEKSILLAWIEAGAPETSTIPIPGLTPSPTNPVPAPNPRPTPMPAPAPAPTTPNFAEIKSQILDGYCLACHGRFASYDVVKANLTSIQSRVQSNRMPPSAPLPQPLKDLLSKWIQAGAPGPSAPGSSPVCITRGGHDDDPCDDRNQIEEQFTNIRGDVP